MTDRFDVNLASCRKMLVQEPNDSLPRVVAFMTEPSGQNSVQLVRQGLVEIMGRVQFLDLKLRFAEIIFQELHPRVTRDRVLEEAQSEHRYAAFFSRLHGGL